MQKIMVSILAMLLLSTVSVYAGGGKKKAKKAKAKIECCSNTVCDPGPNCTPVKNSEQAKTPVLAVAKITSTEKPDCCPEQPGCESGQTSCGNGQPSCCTKQE
jgi:hypothetical protein